MLANLYINSKSPITLAEFAQQAFSLLNISKFEERESCNYPDGHYFRGSALGFEVKISDADDSSIPGLQFWMVIKSQQGRNDDDSFFEHIAKMVAYSFLKADYEVLKDEPSVGSRLSGINTSS